MVGKDRDRERVGRIEREGRIEIEGGIVEHGAGRRYTLTAPLFVQTWINIDGELKNR